MKTVKKTTDDGFEYETTNDGKLICPYCGHPMTFLTQEMYDTLKWEWDDKEHIYRSSQDLGGADKIKCGNCDVSLSREYDDILGC